MGSAAAHEVAEDAPLDVEVDAATADDAAWLASLTAVEAVIAAASPCGDGCSPDRGGADGLMAEALQKFLEDAIDGVPLPKPWSLRQDACGSVFFLNISTGASQWDHPLGAALAELCALCCAYLRVPLDRRAELLGAVQQHWEAEARTEFAKWHAVEHEDGRAYYYHEDSGETTWDHPRVVVLPPYYMRLRAIARLGKHAYVDELCTAMSDVRVRCMTDADSLVHPAEDRLVQSEWLQHTKKQTCASNSRFAVARVCQTTCADMYFIGDCPGMVATEKQLQCFDLAASDNAPELNGYIARPVQPDPLSQWYEVH